MFSRLKISVFMLILSTSLCNAKNAYAQSEPIESASWRDSVNKQILPVKLPFQKLVRNIEMNNTPAVAVLTEICKKGGVRVITDRSLDNKKITAKFSNATLNEILSKILEACSAHVKPLTDDIFLVEVVGAENDSYEVRHTELPSRTLLEQESLPSWSPPVDHRYGEIPPPPSMNNQFVPPPPP